MTKFATFSVLVVACAALAHSAGIDKAKLKFKVAGKQLLDKDTGFGTSDPYYEVSLSDDGGMTKTKIGKSDTVSDQENPEWGNTFTVDFDRKKNQYLYFHVYDEDNLREDDTLGRVYINLADYVDKGQLVNANLDKKGYITVRSADPVAETRSTALGVIPLPAGTPDSQTLRFKLSAQNLPTKDDVAFIPGSSDPYVIVTSTEGVSGKEKELARTATVSSSSSPNWGDVLTFQWNKNKDQRLHFKIYDDDTLREDDKLGQGWMEVNDYVAHGQSYTIILAKKGVFKELTQQRTLTITKA